MPLAKNLKRFKKLAAMSLAALMSLSTFAAPTYAAPGEYTINLKVPAKTGENAGTYDYLNGAEYKIYLKYKINEKGQLLDPLTDAPVQEENRVGEVKPGFFDTAKEYGSVTINGQNNEVVLMDKDTQTKNVKGIYVVKPVKRAPGYHLDVRPDGKLAEVEFPRLENGKVAANQTVDITIKENPAVQKDDLTLFIKKGEDKQPLQGVTFELNKIAKPKVINGENRVGEFEDLLAPEKIMDITSGQDGKVVVPLANKLYEGKYELKETNAKELGLGEIAPIVFTYTANAEGKMLLKFEKGAESIYLDATQELENGESFSLYNYKDSRPTKKIVMTDKSKVDKTSLNPETPYQYEVRFKFPADWANFNEITLTDVLNEAIDPIFDKNQPEIVDYADYTQYGDFVYKKKENMEEMQKIQIYYEKGGVQTAIAKDDNYTFAYTDGTKEMKLTMSSAQIEALSTAKLGLQKDTRFPDATGDIVVRFFTKLDGAQMQDNHFEAQFEGIENTSNEAYKKVLRHDLTSNPQAKDYANASNKTHVRPVRAKVQFLKVDKADPENKKLDGAEFKIVPKGIKDEAQAITPYDSDTNIFRSQNGGVVDIPKLPYLKTGYDLIEITAPDGYRKPGDVFELEFQGDNVVDIAQADQLAAKHDLSIGDTAGALKIENIKKGEEIVSTGTVGTVGILGLGGLVLAFRNKLKKRESEQE